MDDHSSCHYAKDFVAVDPEGEQPGDLGDPLAGVELGDEILRTPDVPNREQVLDQLAAIINVYRVPGDPVEVSGNQPDGVRMAPIHASWHETHRGYMTGTDPKVVADAELETPPPARRDRWIAVVDTGLSTKALPSWLTDNVVVDPRIDDDDEYPNPNKASHGTFVAGLLRQIAPEHAVSLVSARSADTGLWQTPPPESAIPPSSELHVAEAIVRLVLRHEQLEGEVQALNLSLGVGLCGSPDKALAVTFEAAIRYWQSRHPAPRGRHDRWMDGCEVFAAAGNTNNPLKIYPAALDSVRGVAASPYGVRLTVVWDRSHNMVAADPRPWIMDAAPGVGVVNLEGNGDRLVSWSGSSFASAAAAASYVGGHLPQWVDGNYMWWG